jgi:hypothetical protein
VILQINLSFYRILRPTQDFHIIDQWRFPFITFAALGRFFGIEILAAVQTPG